MDVFSVTSAEKENDGNLRGSSSLRGANACVRVTATTKETVNFARTGRARPENRVPNQTELTIKIAMALQTSATLTEVNFAVKLTVFTFGVSTDVFISPDWDGEAT